MLKFALVGLAALALVVLSASSGRANRAEVERFATLPPGPGHPEGIAADAQGNIYVATFDFTTQNKIHIFRRNGKLRGSITLASGVVPLGMEFDAAGNLFVADFGNGKVLKFTPPFGSSSTAAATFAVCAGSGAGCGLNALAFDSSGKLYVSDSFGGRIFRIDPATGAVTTFFQHDLLQPGSHGFPGFGANGIAFNAAGTDLFIANTADDRLLKLHLATLALSTFAESVNGADGIAFDASGRLWVAANQADEVVALNGNGRVVDRRGSFRGIGQDGAPRGLLFPASIVISRGDIFVTNLALALTPMVGDEPEEDVTTFTVSRFELQGKDADDDD